MEHRMDMFEWCERCGLSALRIVDGNLACVAPPPEVLAARRLASIVASAPLVRIANEVLTKERPRRRMI
jgi:hypothetical protein